METKLGMLLHLLDCTPYHKQGPGFNQGAARSEEGKRREIPSQDSQYSKEEIMRSVLIELLLQWMFQKKKLKINLCLVTTKMLWGGKGVRYLDELVPQ